MNAARSRQKALTTALPSSALKKRCPIHSKQFTEIFSLPLQICGLYRCKFLLWQAVTRFIEKSINIKAVLLLMGNASVVRLPEC